MENEQLDILDLITMFSFMMGVQNLSQAKEILAYLNSHEEKIDQILKNQEAILNGLGRKENS